VTRRVALPAPPPEADRASLIAGALDSSGWDRAGERIDDVRVFRTPCHSVNNVTTIDGFPVGTITTIFGPSGSGKTALALAACRGMIQAGGIAAYIDAERRLRDSDHVAQMMGFVSDGEPIPKEEWPNSFWAQDPEKSMDIDTAVADTTRFADTCRKMSKKHSWFPGGILVIDSIDTLLPKKSLESSRKDLKGNDAKVDVDMVVKGHQGREQAARAADWTKRLIQEAADCNVAVIFICQERTDTSGYFPIPYPRGGKAVWFYASLVLRITGVNKKYYRTSAKTGIPVGTVHEIQFRKSSLSAISLTDGNHLTATMYISNGSLFPAGIDEWTDMVVAGLKLGILTQKGSVRYGDIVLGRGVGTAAEKLCSDSELYTRICDEYYARVDDRMAMHAESVESDDSATVTSPFKTVDFPMGD
jgi:RecA/RadA recombinase